MALLSSKAEKWMVVKRNGAGIQPFNSNKILIAISKAWSEVRQEELPSNIHKVVNWVINALKDKEDVQVEDIQDTVEIALMKFDYLDVAKAYILYRQKRKEIRESSRDPDTKAISDYIHYAKYARYLPAELRREVYEESVARVEAMHTKKFPQIADDIKWAFDLVRQKKLLPSMRSMQYAGKAIEVNNARIFNCSFSHADRPRVFQEALWLLLSGCGVGYSVQFDHVEKLPVLNRIDKDRVKHVVIPDSIEGWADAMGALVDSYMQPEAGENIEFSYHLIRNKGQILKTAGGKAPGHLRLKEAIEAVRGVLSHAEGRKLRPIEVHDILCHIADCVVSGGIRSSAMIALFSIDDSEMMNAKTGNWYDIAPWRTNSNNSCIIKRGETSKKQYKRIFQMTKQWGEPGVVFVDDIDYGGNPCFEIGLYPKIKITESVLAELKATKSHYSEVRDLKVGDVHTAWSFCNLCEMNASKFNNLSDFMEAAKAATIIGTCQAAYTNMPYLGWASEYCAEREALLGVSMTGIMRSPDIALNKSFQQHVAKKVVEWNVEYASKIGIKPAARSTCVKPAGTSTLELGAGSSGITLDHAERYIRRVTADDQEAVFQHMKAKNPHMCVRKPNGKWVIEFPMKSPPSALLRENVSAIEFLEMVKSTQQNWVIPGTGHEETAPGLRHNVSNTVTVKTHEWEDVAEYIWQNQDYFTGVSLLAYTGDKDYAFAPNEAVVTKADEDRYNHLIASYTPVDYTDVLEYEDGTNLSGEAACSGPNGCGPR